MRTRRGFVQGVAALLVIPFTSRARQPDLSEESLEELMKDAYYVSGTDRCQVCYGVGVHSTSCCNVNAVRSSSRETRKTYGLREHWSTETGESVPCGEWCEKLHEAEDRALERSMEKL